MDEEQRKKEWERVSRIMAAFSDKAVWKTPQTERVVSNNMPVSAILGNGAVGVTSYDNTPGCKRYLLSRGDFWGDASETWGYRGRTPNLMTVGGLLLSAAAAGRAAGDCNYREELDIARAEIRTQTMLGNLPVRIVSWLSAACDVMVTTVTSLAERDGVLEISPYASVENKTAAALCPVESGTEAERGIVWASRRTNAQSGARFVSEAVIASRLVDAAPLSVNAGRNAAVLQTRLPAGGAVTIATAVTGAGGCGNADLLEDRALCRARELLARYDTVNAVNALHSAHLRWWRDYYLLSWVDFHDADLNRVYYGQQYIFGSTVREGAAAPGLYGVWRTQDTPGWQGDYHLNYNFQATWYGACAGNRIKGFFEPFTNAVLAFMDSGLARSADVEQLRRIGKKADMPPNACSAYLEARLASREDLGGGIPGGVLYPVGIVPYVRDKDYCKYEGQTMDAWFCAVMLLEYYEMTCDTVWLTKPRHGHTPYEFLTAVAAFYEKWLEKRAPRASHRFFSEPEDGDVYTRAVKSMGEYPPYTGGADYVYILLDGATEDFRDCNPTAYLGVLRRLFGKLIDISRTLGRDAGRRARWADIRDHLARPQGNVFSADGKQILGFSENDYQRVKPGAVSGAEVQLELVQPGGVWGFDSDPAVLELCRNTIDHHNTWTWNNSVPKVYAHAARTGYDPAQLLGHMKGAGILGAMEKNYHIYDGVHGVEKVGFLQALHDLLVQEDGGIVKLFPALPPGQPAGFTRIRTKGAFLLSARRNAQGAVGGVDVVSEKGGRLTLVNPWGTPVSVEPRAAAKEPAVAYGQTRRSGEQTVIVETEAGAAYRISQRGAIKACRTRRANEQEE